MRETWLSLLDINHHKVNFVIGIKSVSSSVAAKLYEENLKHKDLLLLSDLDDEYHTLTQKILFGFKTINKSNFKYVLKCDDDSYVNIKHMTNEINKIETQSLYWGYFRGDAKVKTQGQWKEEEWNLCDNYLPYAHGGGYVLSKDLVSFVVNNMEYWRMFNSEDVSLGAWLAAVKTTRRHDTRFNTEYRSRGCLNTYLVMHKQSSEDMKELHKNLLRKGKMCGIERQFIPSFEYNWNVLPSKCCIKQKLSLT
jgi:galactosylxylosylprotein 3-beta-galactosyltransferase